MKRILSFAIAAMFIITVFAAPVFAEDEKSKLKSFEKEIDEPQTSEPQQNTQSEYSTTSSIDSTTIAADSIFAILMQFFMMGLSNIGVENFSELNAELKKEWHPALPTIRVEPAYQYLVGGMQGFSGKVEAGYLILGVDGEFTRYFEKAPNSSLNIIQAHALLRTIFTKYFGTNLAIGVKNVCGGQSRTGIEFGLPFYIFISKNFIFDVLPYLATIKTKNIWDIGGGLSYKWKFVGVRAGYRAQFVGDEKLHGPRIGVFFQW